MKFAELTEAQRNKVFTEIVRAFMENGETFEDAMECAKQVIEDLDRDNRFYLEDYSPDEDGTDIRVEY